MDPIAAIGLAGNIVQFVGFTWKLIDEAKSLYDSNTGVSEENDLLELIVNDLNDLNGNLTAPSALGAIPGPVRSLASKCKGVASELLETLDSIKVKGRGRKWKSFLQALRSVWKKGQIEGLVKRLKGLRDEMQFGLQLALCEQNSEIQKALSDLAIQNRRLAMDSEHKLEDLANDVHSAISQLKVEVTAQKVIVNDRSEVHILPRIDAGALTPSRVMENLSSMLVNLTGQINATASDQLLLNSLFFDNIKQRRENISDSHRKTFEWVLDPSSPTNLLEWLRHRNGIYWITGKAGSGKSTLMKFLINHRHTAELLREWAGTKRLIFASFFFWYPGTAIQKSQEGLFKSLLYEILRQCPDLIRTVCASKAKTIQPFVKNVEPWTQHELWYAIGQLKQHSGVDVRFCFFIDGLDEYDGDSDRLLEVLESLRSWPDIKLCVSSRPWNEFIDAFGGTSDAQFALENLTREDIRIYIKETLEDSLDFRQLSARDARSQDLIQEIVEKARGVFLWVVLVVRSLLRGLRNADGIIDLQMRLRGFPNTLEQFFRHMLGSVEDVYQTQTAQPFKFTLEAAEPLTLLTHSFLDEEDLDAVIASSGNRLTLHDFSTRHDDMRRRLNGRCKGLLEVVDGSFDSTLPVSAMTFKVDFLHRTVFDFLLTKDMQLMLSEHLSPTFDPRKQLCKAFVAQMKLVSPHQSEYWGSYGEELLENLTYYAHEIEISSNVPQVRLMDDVSHLIHDHAAIFGVKAHETGFLEFLVHRRLYLYLAVVLTRKPGMISTVKTALLGSALKPQKTKYFPPINDTRMVSLLLENGAMPNGRDGRSTVWGIFLESIHHRATMDEDVVRVIECLLRYGANRRFKIAVRQQTVASKPSGRAADLHEKFVEQTVYRNVEDILRKPLGEARLSEVLSQAQNPPSSRKSLNSTLVGWKNRWGSSSH